MPKFTVIYVRDSTLFEKRQLKINKIEISVSARSMDEALKKANSKRKEAEVTKNFYLYGITFTKTKK